MKVTCYLLYDHVDQFPVNCLDTVDEVAAFLSKSKETVRSQLCRFRQGKIKYVRDEKGHKYEIYKIKLVEEDNE